MKRVSLFATTFKTIIRLVAIVIALRHIVLSNDPVIFIGLYISFYYMVLRYICSSHVRQWHERLRAYRSHQNEICAIFICMLQHLGASSKLN